MSEQDFLTYVSGVTATPRCSLSTSHLARLYHLAGHDDQATKMKHEPEAQHQADRQIVRSLVSEALAMRLERDNDNHA